MESQNNNYTISLPMLIDFAIQKIYQDISILSEILPRKNDFERKLDIINFSENTRKTLIRLSQIIKWVKNISIQTKCKNILNFIENQEAIYSNSADYLANLSRKILPDAKVPKYLIKEASNILTTGSFNFIPLCVKDRILEIQKLDEKEKDFLFKRLDLAIRSRIIIEGLPISMKLINIDDGFAHFEVQNEFHIVLTLKYKSFDCDKNDASRMENTFNDLNTCWFIKDISILLPVPDTCDISCQLGQFDGSMGHIVEPNQITFVKSFLQDLLGKEGVPNDTDAPLVKIYNFLHSFCQGLIIESLYNEVTWNLSNQMDTYNCKIIFYKPNDHFIFSYWNEAPSSGLDRFVIKIAKPESSVLGEPESQIFPTVPQPLLKVSHYPVSLVKAFDNYLKEKVTTFSENLAFGMSCENEKSLRNWILRTNHTSSCLDSEIKPCDPFDDWSLSRDIFEIDASFTFFNFVRDVVRKRAYQKLFILQAFFEVFGDPEWKYEIVEENITPLPHLKMFSKIEHIEDSVLFSINRTNGLLHVQVPYHPDVNGDLILLVEQKLNTCFNGYLINFLPFELDMEKKRATALEEMIEMSKIILRTLRVYLLTLSYIQSIQHLSTYININYNHFYHNNDPLLNSYNYFVTNLEKKHVTPSTDKSDNRNFNTIVLLILNFSKFKAYHLIIKYIELENGYEIILYLAFYPRYSASPNQPVNTKENSVLEIYKGKYEWSEEAACKEKLEDDSIRLLSHFVTKFEALIPISEIARALQSTQEKNKLKNFYDLNQARIKHSQIVRIERDTLATFPDSSEGQDEDVGGAGRYKDVSFEYGLVLNFESKNEQAPSLILSAPDIQQHQLKSSEAFKPVPIFYFNTFHISKAVFTIQGKNSRFWFVTIYLSCKNERDAVCGKYLKNKVYFQYFNIPYTKYQDVAELFFRDIKSIITLGAYPGLIAAPPASNNGGSMVCDDMKKKQEGDVITVPHLFQYNYKRMIVSYGPQPNHEADVDVDCDSDNSYRFYAKIQTQDLPENLRLQFYCSSYLAYLYGRSPNRIDVPQTSVQLLSRNPHALIKDLLEYDVNKYKITVRDTLKVLTSTLPIMEVFNKLDDTPYVDLIDKINLEASLFRNKDFTYVPLSVKRHLVTYKKFFGLLFTINLDRQITITVQDYSDTDDANFCKLISLKNFIKFHTLPSSKDSANEQDAFTKTDDEPNPDSGSLDMGKDFIDFNPLIMNDCITLSINNLRHLFDGRNNKSGNSLIELYLKALYTMKCTLEIVGAEDNLQLVKPSFNFNELDSVEPKGLVIFQSLTNGLKCQIRLDEKKNYESVTFELLDGQSQMASNVVQSSNYSIYPQDNHTFNLYIEKKVNQTPHIFSNLVSVYRCLTAPITVFRDCLELMRLELYGLTANNGQLQQSQINYPTYQQDTQTLEPSQQRWFLNWILTIPPLGPVLATIGSPSVIIKNKMLFLIGLKSNPDTGNHVNQSIIIPLIYDLTTNLSQMADPTRFANFTYNAALMNSITLILKRFTEFHCQNYPNQCSIYPAIKEVILNLVPAS